MSDNQESNDERPCLHCLIGDLIDEFYSEYGSLSGEADTIDADEIIKALAKTVADINLEQMGRTDDVQGTRLLQMNATGFDYTSMVGVFGKAGEHHLELHRVRVMQVEGMHADVVEALQRETRFLHHFPHGRLLGLFSRLDPAMHHFPCAGTACVGGTLECEHAPLAI